MSESLQHRLREALQNNDFATAVECLEARVRNAQASGDRAGEGRYLGNLALMYHRLGRSEEALDCFERGLALVRAEGDQLSEDGILGNMGNVLREMGRYDEALEFLYAALALAEEIGDLRGRGIWLSNLGLVFDDLGQSGEAIAFHEESLLVARDLRDQRGQATRLGKLSDSYLAAGDPLEALKTLGEALSILSNIADHSGLLHGLQRSASIHSDLAFATHSPQEARLFFGGALDYYRDALLLARAEGEHNVEAMLLASIGKLMLSLAETESAQRFLTEARDRFAALGDEAQAAAIATDLLDLKEKQP